MKSLYESSGKVGDPDGTRKRPAHLSGDSLADAAQQYQALNDQRSLQRAIKARPVDKKTDKWERIFGRSPLRFCLFIGTCLLMGLVSTCARATEAYYNPQGSPLPTKEMEVAIRYAAESAWSQRIDEGAVYAGLTGEESTEDSIIVRWAYFPLPESSALSLEAGLEAHSANLSGSSVTLANARWWTANETGELVKAVISINIMEATETVDKCMYELLTHEFGHVFSPHSRHSEYPEDVMFWSRGDCRYSPSLTDLAMFDISNSSPSCSAVDSGPAKPSHCSGPITMARNWRYRSKSRGAGLSSPPRPAFGGGSTCRSGCAKSSTNTQQGSQGNGSSRTKAGSITGIQTY